MQEVKHFNEVYCDELGSLIDENIERKKDMTDAQYRAGIFREIVMS
jgi:hypothetical protein